MPLFSHDLFRVLWRVFTMLLFVQWKQAPDFMDVCHNKIAKTGFTFRTIVIQDNSHVTFGTIITHTHILCSQSNPVGFYINFSNFTELFKEFSISKPRLIFHNIFEEPYVPSKTPEAFGTRNTHYYKHPTLRFPIIFFTGMTKFRCVIINNEKHLASPEKIADMFCLQAKVGT